MAVLGAVVDSAGGGQARTTVVKEPRGYELITVADDEAVAYAGPELVHYVGLEPDTAYDLEGLAFRTLVRPPGERLATVATVNDVHFGETECGVIDGSDVGPILRSAPGEPPYPEVMNRAAASEILALAPDAVVAKGDLTTRGAPEEYEAFQACYGIFGDRLHAVRGNHDAYYGATFAATPCQEVTLPGVVLAILDTSIPRRASGRVTTEQLGWLDELGSRADRPVLVFGHHHIWSPSSRSRPAEYFGINPDDSDGLVEVVARRPRLVGYFAGHTHRNRVRRMAATGTFPWTEVSATKDFPGVWAEYRVFEGGVLQVLRRISDPAALDWTERTRGMYEGLYAEYALGQLDDRCFPVWPR